MNQNFILKILFVVFLICSASHYMVAQNKTQAESISQAHFNNLDAEHQRILFHQWVNKSQMSVLPDEFENRARDYFQSRENLNDYKKQRGILKAIFNEDIHLIDRINFCNYLLKLFSEEEMPLFLIEEQKVLFMKKLIKP